MGTPRMSAALSSSAACRRQHVSVSRRIAELHEKVKTSNALLLEAQLTRKSFDRRTRMERKYNISYGDCRQRSRRTSAPNIVALTASRYGAPSSTIAPSHDDKCSKSES